LFETKAGFINTAASFYDSGAGFRYLSAVKLNPAGKILREHFSLPGGEARRKHAEA
jgi:hypothetical protein